MSLPVNLDDVVAEMQVVSDEMTAYINRKTGELVTLTNRVPVYSANDVPGLDHRHAEHGASADALARAAELWDVRRFPSSGMLVVSASAGQRTVSVLDGWNRQAAVPPETVTRIMLVELFEVTRERSAWYGNWSSQIRGVWSPLEGAKIAALVEKSQGSSWVITEVPAAAFIGTSASLLVLAWPKSQPDFLFRLPVGLDSISAQAAAHVRPESI